MMKMRRPFVTKQLELNSKTLLAQIELQQSDFYKTSSELLKIKFEWDSLDQIKNADHLENGVHSLKYNEYLFESLLLAKQNAEKLYVLFSGARKTNSNNEITDTLPRFKRWSFHPIFDGHVLIIDDPMYYKYSNLVAGWFFGTSNSDLISLCLDVIHCFSTKLKIPNDHIIFYGSSAGGYAAIAAAARSPNTLAVAINPQLRPHLFKHGASFHSITGIDLAEKDSYGRNDLITVILEATRSQFFIIQNAQASHDIKNHFLPLCKRINLSLNYGLSHKNNLLTWLYSSKGGHTAYENKQLLWFILSIASNFKAQKKLLNIDTEMIVLISELWGSLYNK